MKKDMTELKKLIVDIIQNEDRATAFAQNQQVIDQLYRDVELPHAETTEQPTLTIHEPSKEFEAMDEHAEEVEESLSLPDKEAYLIKKALNKYKGKRKLAAEELGISERTLYRKIKDLGMN